MRHSTIITGGSGCIGNYVIRLHKPLLVYGKGEKVCDCPYVVDCARAIDVIFHKGNTAIAETYNIGGFNKRKNIDVVKFIFRIVDGVLGSSEEYSENLFKYVTIRADDDLCYAINPRKHQRELCREPSIRFEDGIKEPVLWLLKN